MSAPTTTCVLVEPPGRVTLGRCLIPTLRANDVRVQTEYSAISPGTELRCLLQAGQPGASPFVPGYAAVGRVVEVGPEVDRAWLNRRVFHCGSRETKPYQKQWGGHLAEAVLPIERCVAVDEAADPQRVCLSKLAAIALHGVRLARVSAADRVVVLGLGVIGQLVVRWCLDAGAAVVGVDRCAERVSLAEQSGAAGLSLHADEPPPRPFEGRGGDVVFDATGVAAVLPTAVGMLRETPWNTEPIQGPRLVIQGSYPGDACFPYQDVFDRQAALLVPRDHDRRDLHDAVETLSRDRLPTTSLHAGVTNASDASDVYRTLTSASPPLIACLDWTASRN